MTTTITFEVFSEFAKANGFEPVKQGNTNFLIRTKHNAKIEVKTSSGVFVIGYGMPKVAFPTAMDLVKANGFSVVKEASGYANLKFTCLDDIIGLAMQVDEAIESVKGAAKTPKAKNIHAESNKLIAKAIKSGAIKVPEFKVTKSPEEIERIRAANLAKMQEITARHKKLKKEYMKGQVADEEAAGHTGVEDFDAEEAKAEVAAILNNQGLIRVVPKFLQY